MGNNSSKQLQADYIDGRYRIFIQHQDPYVGQYQLLKLSSVAHTSFLRKSLNPTGYDSYNCDYDLLSAKMSKNCKALCEFQFLTESAVGEGYFDLLFEFGNYINSKFNDEEVIWDFINSMLEGLVHLQAEGLHYPTLRKKYTVYVSNSDCFKLLNPFCFKNFIDKAITVYFNCDVDLTEKADFSRANINRNVKEFGIMILALIENTDEIFFIKNPQLIIPTLKKLKGKYSEKLINFLAFVIKGKGQMNFVDLRNFLENDSYGSMMKLGSKDSFPSFVQRKITTKNSDFGVGGKQKVEVSKRNYNSVHKLPQNTSSSGNNRQVNQMDSNKYIQNYSHKVNEYGSNTQIVNKDPPPSQQEPQQQGMSFVPDLLDNTNKNIQLAFGNDVFNTNNDPSPQVDEVETNDPHDKGSPSISSNFDLRGLHKTIQDINANKTQTTGKSKLHQEMQEKMKQLHGDFKEKQESVKDVPEEKQFVPEPPKPKKKIKRYLMKWIAAEKRHKEFVEYEDGTQEETGGKQDNKQIKNVLNDYYTKNDISKPDFIDTKGNKEEEEPVRRKPKKSAMKFDVTNVEVSNEPHQIVSKNNYSIILYTNEDNDPPKLLLSTTVEEQFAKYNFMKNIVNFKSALRVSNYHNLGED